MTRRLWLLILILAAGVAPAFSLAQKEKEDLSVRSVEGTVTDEHDRPLEGAVVQLKNVKTLQIRSFITQADGKYQFQGLSVNVDFELRASHGGNASAPKILSTFDSRRRPVVNLKVESKKK